MAPNPGGWAPRLEADQQRGGHLQTRPGSVPSRAVPSGLRPGRNRCQVSDKVPASATLRHPRPLPLSRGCLRGDERSLHHPGRARPSLSGRSRPSRGPWPQNTKRRRAALSAEPGKRQDAGGEGTVALQRSPPPPPPGAPALVAPPRLLIYTKGGRRARQAPAPRASRRAPPPPPPPAPWPESSPLPRRRRRLPPGAPPPASPFPRGDRPRKGSFRPRPPALRGEQRGSHLRSVRLAAGYPDGRKGCKSS